MYASIVIIYIARVRINRVRLPILLAASGTAWKVNISLSPFAPENLVSRDGFSSPVPRQAVHLHTQIYVLLFEFVHTHSIFYMGTYTFVHGYQVSVKHTIFHSFFCIDTFSPSRLIMSILLRFVQNIECYLSCWRISERRVQTLDCAQAWIIC